MKTTVVCAHEFGPPETVARVEEWDLPAPGPGETIVEVLAAPINPADLNYLEGTYAERPVPPFVPGIEGVGRTSDGRLVVAPSSPVP
jgi:trans-2-enoyl-CoA reductase